jgi:demethylmenaquinone methyltransferase/2-methoxy-6-polyprenyl-1,4-benzoquinol methylase
VTNKYLSYDEQRAPKVRAMFSRLAPRYDLVNDVMSFGMHRIWKRQTVEIALAGRRGRASSTCAAAAATCASSSPRAAPGTSSAPTSRCRCSP